MITIPTKKLEKVFDKKVIPFITCMGVDTASRTGWCKAETNPDEVKFDYGFIDVKSTDKYFKYDRYIEIFNTFIKVDRLIVEEAFYGRNLKSFQLLSRLGGFVYALAHIHGVEYKRFLLAVSARKYLNFIKCNAKKDIIQKEFITKLNLDIIDEDIIDAMILCLCGVLE